MLLGCYFYRVQATSRHTSTFKIMFILNWPLPIGAFQGQYKQAMINKYSNEQNHIKNPNRQEANQLAIYKRSREVELGATENNIG